MAAFRVKDRHEQALHEAGLAHLRRRARRPRRLGARARAAGEGLPQPRHPHAGPQPIKEEYLLTGPLEPTNRPYALAKIAGIEMCWSYNRQYGTRYLCAMPNNMYGPGDNYDLQTGHVLPALIRKFHEAKVRREKTVVLWGSGKPRREFVYSDDMADACIYLMNLPGQQIAAAFNPQQPPLFNIGHGKDQTIRELAEAIKRIVESDAGIAYDRSKPDGTPQKLLDTAKLAALGWRPRVALEEGLRLAYASFKIGTDPIFPGR